MGGILEMINFREFLLLVLVIVLLNVTGIWPQIARAFRDLRGDKYTPETDAPPPASERKDDLDVCYKMLGVSPSAPWDEIEKAYRRKAKVHHPDLGGDEDAMRALNDAYNYLKRRIKR